ncbi:MAG: hypothetical protein IPH74_14335 [Bacteroidetes bacterium]|jgi:hypothetical protein|nr:hypothetical protein [Bacteroidota bacterium]MBP7257289.1 hypothetical protein [Chitinophagales bacterium]MBK7140113.1 hypothetical protein [Bacteroidota bacterium]MBK7503807.1 hypothetical protein [Bacteroidota bacterium]MBK8674122.1 hypothetical protein [Bacteroidota bacterium]
MYSNFNKVLSLIICLFIVSNTLFAQEASPYSRYGIGSLGDYNFVQSASMGGLGTAYRAPEGISFVNPASYTALSMTSFEAGANISMDRLKTATLKDSRGTGGLNYIALSFPIGKKIGISAGLIPLSKKDYFLTDTAAFVGTDGELLAKEFEGSGGINHLYFGAAYKIKGLSVGANFAYLFGKLNNNSFAYPLQETFKPDPFSSTTWKSNELQVKGIYYNLGAQYQLKLKGFAKESGKDTIKMTIGVSGNPSIKLGKLSTLDEGTYTFNTSQFYGNLPRGENQGIKDYVEESLNFNGVDTIAQNIGQKTQVKIPGVLNVGLNFDQGIKWQAGIDFRFQPWKNYKGYENNGASVLQNSWRIGLGGEILPDPSFKGKFGSKLKYRAGISYGQTQVVANNTSINEFTANIGFGIPINNAISNDEGYLFKVASYSFNLGLEVGTRGTTKNDLLKENFFRFKFGFSFNDRWFVRRKFN